ncbi:MAG: hypothetical protein U1E73_09525 [Planctomycetota bacterium]
MLDPLGQGVPPSMQPILDQTIKTNQAQIRNALEGRAIKQDDKLRILLELGQLKRLSLDSLPPEVQVIVREAVSTKTERALKRARKGGVEVTQEAVEKSLLDEELSKHARDMVPGACAFLETGDGVWVATKDQLSDLQTDREFVAYQKTVFLQEVLDKFIAMGLISEVAASDEYLRFLSIMKL